MGLKNAKIKVVSQKIWLLEVGSILAMSQGFESHAGFKEISPSKGGMPHTI